MYILVMHISLKVGILAIVINILFTRVHYLIKKLGVCDSVSNNDNIENIDKPYDMDLIKQYCLFMNADESYLLISTVIMFGVAALSVYVVLKNFK